MVGTKMSLWCLKADELLILIGKYTFSDSTEKNSQVLDKGACAYSLLATHLLGPPFRS